MMFALTLGAALVLASPSALGSHSSKISVGAICCAEKIIAASPDSKPSTPPGVRTSCRQAAGTNPEAQVSSRDTAGASAISILAKPSVPAGGALLTSPLDTVELRHRHVVPLRGSKQTVALAMSANARWHNDDNVATHKVCAGENLEVVLARKPNKTTVTYNDSPVAQGADLGQSATTAFRAGLKLARFSPDRAIALREGTDSAGILKPNRHSKRSGAVAAQDDAFGSVSRIAASASLGGPATTSASNAPVDLRREGTLSSRTLHTSFTNVCEKVIQRPFDLRLAQTHQPQKGKATVSDQSSLLGPKFFVLGVWQQPDSLMATWKARGVNTFVSAPGGWDVLTWAKAAGAAGLYQIREPSKDLIFDVNDRYLLAWSTTDEPSDTKSTLSYSAVAKNPAAVMAETAPLRAAAAAVDKIIPIFTNHVAGHIYPDWAQNNALMIDYMQGPESDWLSSDGYPIQEHQPFVIVTNDGYTSTTQGVSLDRQGAWSDGKPMMAFIGVSAYKDTAVVPTVGQFNAMAWSSVIHGATGINYFSISLSPFSWDVTPPALVQAITTFNNEIKSIDSILIDEIRGGRDPYTVYRSANVGAAPKPGQLPYPFEATEIKTAQGVYRIVLNLSDQDQVLDKPEWGFNKATFHAYDVQRGFAAGLPAGGVASSTPTDGNDLLTAAAGAAEIHAGPGNDTLIGANVQDYLRGDDGDDSISGGSAFDDANGNAGNDTVSTGAGEDYCVGGKDNDSLSGGADYDLVYGNLGNDTCNGDDGDDIVRGGQGNDVVNGGNGNDYVSGDKGDDTMSGGAGADIFHTFGDAGIDRVIDFNLAQGDRVQLDLGTVFILSQVGADTVIAMTGGGQMTLVGIQLSSLTGNWIFGA